MQFFRYKNYQFFSSCFLISSRRSNGYREMISRCSARYELVTDISSANVDCLEQIAGATNKLASTAEETPNRSSGQAILARAIWQLEL